MKALSHDAQPTTRNVLFILLLVAAAVFMLLAFPCAQALANNGSATTSGAVYLSGVSGTPPGPATLTTPNSAGSQEITLTRQSDAAKTLPESISFAVGSNRYTSDGTLYTMDAVPFIKDGRVYLPVRYMGYALGMVGRDITWDPYKKSAVFSLDSHTVTFTLDSKIFYIDGTGFVMDVEPVMLDGHLNIPARYFAAAFGYNVTWDQDPAAPQPRLIPNLQGIFIVVDSLIPQRLYVVSGSTVLLATYCNTGIQEAPTPKGLFSIFAKLPSDTMTGTDPDGTKYYDPGVPWVMYFYGGCAIHGFIRSAYGFPQSVGCVELPVPEARKVYALARVGTQVYIE